MSSIPADQFADQVYAALRDSFSDLLNSNQDQTFYAFALFTDDSLQFLHPVANTEEALIATVQHYNKTVDPKYGCTSTRAGMRWSYGDWGFFPDVGADYFEDINDTLRSNFDSPEDVFESQVDSLWESILNGFVRLERERFFGTGIERSRITLLLVGDLAEELTDSWVSALNRPDVANRYLNWDYEAAD